MTHGYSAEQRPFVCGVAVMLTHDFRVAVEGGEVQRRSAVLVCVVDDRTFLHQKLHNILVSFQTGPAQGSQPLLVHGSQRGTFETNNRGLTQTCGRELMSIDPLGIYSGPGWMVLVLELTFRKQKLYSAEVTLAGGHHQQGPALLVAHINIGTVLQQLLCNLKNQAAYIRL